MSGVPSDAMGAARVVCEAMRRAGHDLGSDVDFVFRVGLGCRVFRTAGGADVEVRRESVFNERTCAFDGVLTAIVGGTKGSYSCRYEGVSLLASGSNRGGEESGMMDWTKTRPKIPADRLKSEGDAMSSRDDWMRYAGDGSYGREGRAHAPALRAADDPKTSRRVAGGVNLLEVFDWDWPKSKPPGDVPTRSLSELADLRSSMDAIARVSRMCASRDETTAIVSMRDRHQKSINDARARLMSSSGWIPPEERRDDAVGLLAASPTVALADVREVADLLGFSVFPFAYLSEKAYEGEPAETRQRAGIFAKAVTVRSQAYGWGSFVPYVLAPIGLYSPAAHARSEDVEMYVSPAAAPIMTAIDMVVPALRIMFADIEELKGRVSKVEGRVSKVEKSVADLDVRVSRLQDQMEAERRARVEQAIAARDSKLREAESVRSGAWSSGRRAIALDPMMLAVPDCNSVCAGDGRAFVGPCWGPDFMDVVIASLGLKVRRGAREKIEPVTARWKELYGA